MSCHSTFSDLRKKGIGAEVKRTPVITKEEEDQLWCDGDPKQLLNSVFFYVFCAARLESSSDVTVQTITYTFKKQFGSQPQGRKQDCSVESRMWVKMCRVFAR